LERFLNVKPHPVCKEERFSGGKVFLTDSQIPFKEGTFPKRPLCRKASKREEFSPTSFGGGIKASQPKGKGTPPWLGRLNSPKNFNPN